MDDFRVISAQVDEYKHLKLEDLENDLDEELRAGLEEYQNTLVIIEEAAELGRSMEAGTAGKPEEYIGKINDMYVSLGMESHVLTLSETVRDETILAVGLEESNFIVRGLKWIWKMIKKAFKAVGKFFKRLWAFITGDEKSKEKRVDEIATELAVAIEEIKGEPALANGLTVAKTPTRSAMVAALLNGDEIIIQRSSPGAPEIFTFIDELIMPPLKSLDPGTTTTTPNAAMLELLGYSLDSIKDIVNIGERLKGLIAEAGHKAGFNAANMSSLGNDYLLDNITIRGATPSSLFPDGVKLEDGKNARYGFKIVTPAKIHIVAFDFVTAKDDVKEINTRLFLKEFIIPIRDLDSKPSAIFAKDVSEYGEYTPESITLPSTLPGITMPILNDLHAKSKAIRETIRVAREELPDISTLKDIEAMAKSPSATKAMNYSTAVLSLASELDKGLTKSLTEIGKFTAGFITPYIKVAGELVKSVTQTLADEEDAKRASASSKTIEK